MSGKACGKVILVGEHFAVHGGRAIAMPLLTRSISVELSEGRGQFNFDKAPRPPRAKSGTGDEGTFDAPQLERALRAMLDDLSRAIPFDPDRLDVAVSGDLPLAAGLGGSAALAAALVRALGVPAGDVQAFVHRLEHLAHGKPSGVDGAVVSLELPIAFEAGHIGTLSVDQGWLKSPPWWIAVVPRTGSTREAVANVALRREADGAAFDRAARHSLADARVLEGILQRAPDGEGLRKIGGIFDAAHARLAALGVSNDAIERLVNAARTAGAYGAKLTGAGLGGAIVAVAPSGVDLGPALYEAGAIDVITPPGMGA